MPKRSYNFSQETDFSSSSQQEMPVSKKSKTSKTPKKRYTFKKPSTVSLKNQKEYCFTKRICSSPTEVSIIPASGGFVVSGLTTSINLGCFVSGNGFSLYNPTVGASTTVNFPFVDNTSFQTIFDQFRIKKVTVTAFFSSNISNTTTPATTMPLLYTAIDLDGGVAAPNTNAGSLLSYSNCQVHQAGTVGKPWFKRSFVPNFVVSSASTALSSTGQYLDTNTTGSGNAWYGMFIQLDMLGATQSSSMGEINFICEIQYCYKNCR